MIDQHICLFKQYYHQLEHKTLKDRTNFYQQYYCILGKTQ